MSVISKIRYRRRPKIFITYRRNDTDGHAGRLYADLTGPFPKKNVFFDIDTLKAGDEFPAEIERTIQECEALIALIGRNWLTIKEGDRRRIDDPEDLVRREIAAALKRKIVVIPVLVQNALMPDEDDLPQELKRLVHRNAIIVSDHRWDYDVKQLINRLKSVAPRDFSGEILPWPKIGVALIGFVGLAFGVWITMWPSDSARQETPRQETATIDANAGAEQFFYKVGNGDVSLEVIIGHAVFGKFTVTLWDKDGRNPQRIGAGASHGNSPGEFKIGSGSQLAGRIVTIETVLTNPSGSAAFPASVKYKMKGGPTEEIFTFNGTTTGSLATYVHSIKLRD